MGKDAGIDSLKKSQNGGKIYLRYSLYRRNIAFVYGWIQDEDAGSSGFHH